MPVDWEKVERLRIDKFGDARLKTGPGVHAFAEAVGISWNAYTRYVGTDDQVKGGGISLAYVERLADALEVSLGEILTVESRSAEFERGLRNGRLQALAEMHDVLNHMLHETEVE